MLMVASYAKDYVDACHAKVAAQLASYRKVLVAPNWVTGVDWLDEKVAVKVTRDKVKGSPKYAPEKEIDRRYEHDLHSWYGHAPYW